MSNTDIGVVSLIALSLGCTGCLVSDRPHLAREDLVRVEGPAPALSFEGTYRIPDKKNPNEDDYLFIRALPDGRYRVQEWSGSGNKLVHVSILALQGPQPDTSTVSYLAVVEAGSEFIYDEVILDRQTGQYSFGPFFLQGEDASASAIAEKYGLKLEEDGLFRRLKTFGGTAPEVSQVRRLLQDRAFRALVPSDRRTLVRTDTESNTGVSRPLPAWLGAQVQEQEFLASLMLRTLSEHVDDRMVEIAIQSMEGAVFLRERFQGAGWWQTVDAKQLLADVRRLSRMDPAERRRLAEARALALRTVNLYAQGRYDEAVPPARQALDVLRSVLGERHPDYASALSYMAQLQDAGGRYRDAGDLHAQALEIRTDVLGGNHPETASSLALLANHRARLGRWGEAEPMAKKALDALRAVFRPEIPMSLVPPLYSAATTLAVQAADAGRYAEAEQNLRNLVDGGRTFTEDPDLAKFVEPIAEFNLASLEGDRTPQNDEKVRQAKAIAGRFMDVFAYAGRQFYLSYATALSSLAELLRVTNRRPEAEPLLTAALDVARSKLGVNHPVYASTLETKALLELSAGRHAEAEALLREALGVRAAVLGEQHPAYAETLWNLGLALVAARVENTPSELLLRSSKISWQHMAENFPVMSDEQKRNFLRQRRGGHTDVIGTLAFGGDAGSGTVSAAAGLEMMLLNKQLLFEAARHESAALSAAVDSAPAPWRELWLEREQLRGRYATLALQGLSSSRNRHIERPADATYSRSLADRVEQIEQQLRRDHPEYAAAARLQHVTLANVSSVLQAGDAVVEFLKYENYELASGTSGGAQYGAFVLRGGSGEVLAIKLGDAGEIEEAVHAFRAAVRQAIDEFKEVRPSNRQLRRSETAIAQTSAEVRARVWGPMEHALKNVSRVYLAPDGALSLIPFEALATEGDDGWRYLVEERQLVYLTTARDLGRLAMARRSEIEDRRTAVLIGNPAFDATWPQIAATVAGISAASTSQTDPDSTSGPALTLGTATAGAARHELPRNWAPVPILEELLARARKQLEGLGWSVTQLTGTRAVEEAALQVEAPRLLQFATHGYILDKPRNDAGWDNPLLRSMLFLAGANTWQRETAVRYRVGTRLLSEAEARKAGLAGAALEGARLELADGVLTAYEVTGMNLHGTELVNLTACETGLGEVTPDGVAGLRQAFLLAGARASTMSMWEVPAAETTAQMRDFYDRWLGGGEMQSAMTRYGAFRSAQLAALARARETYGVGHPFYWAGTVYVGDPGDLPIERGAR